MRLNNDNSSARTRDEIDYSFEEMNDITMDETALNEINADRQSEYERSSRGTPFVDNETDHSSDDPDYVEEATEILEESSSRHTDENDEDDEFDHVVKRGRGRPSKTKKKKSAHKIEQSSRPIRVTRAASVRI